MRWHQLLEETAKADPRPTLTEIRARRLELARLDPRAGMPVLPPGGAAPSAIQAVERRLGRALPPSYRRLLAMHDGIPCFYQGVSLLGAHHLTRGTYVDLTRLVIDLGEVSRVESARGGRSALIPFGVDAAGETIFAWDTSAPTEGGEMEIVLWMNEIGARVPSFPSFLELVLEMLEGDIADAEERRRAPFLAAGVDSTPAPPVSGITGGEDEDDEAIFAA